MKKRKRVGEWPIFKDEKEYFQSKTCFEIGWNEFTLFVPDWVM